MAIKFLEKLMEGPEKRAADRAERLVAQGRLEQAADALRAGLAKAPQSVSLQLELARVLAQANRRDESAAALRSLLRTEPAAADAVREIAEMAKLRNQPTGHYHEVLAEHALRQGQTAGCHEHLERIDRGELTRSVEGHRKRFDAGIRGASGKVPRAAILSGTYVALALEALGDDSAALGAYEQLLRGDDRTYGTVAPRLENLAARNFKDGNLRLRILDTYLAQRDGERAAAEAERLLQASAATAPPLIDRLTGFVQENPEHKSVRLALARARWIGKDADGAVTVLEPLAEDGSQDDLLSALLTQWRVERPDETRPGLLLAEVLGRGEQGSKAVQVLSEIAGRVAAEQMEPALERLLGRHPGEARAHRLLGELRLTNGDLEGAVKAVGGLREHVPAHQAEGAGILRNVLERTPDHPAALRMLGEILIERGEVPPALILLRRFMQLEPQQGAGLAGPLETLARANPQNARVRLGASEALLLAGRGSEALAHLAVAAQDAAAAAQVAHRLSYLLRTSPDLASEVGPVVDSLAGKLADPAALPFLRAEHAAACGDPERAADLLGQCYGHGRERAGNAVIDALEEILERHPEASSPRMLLAHLLADRGDAPRAVEVVAAAPAPDPGMVALLLERLEKMLTGKPRDLALRTGLAQLLLFAGRPGDALGAAEEALADAGDRAAGDLRLVRAEALLATGERAAAVAGLLDASHAEPNLLPRALATLEAMALETPRDATVRLAQGRLLAASGRVAEGLDVLVTVGSEGAEHAPAALREIDALALQAPEDARPRLAAARLHAAGGRASQAAESVLAALAQGAAEADADAILHGLLRVAPEDPDVLFALGRAAQRRDPSKACGHLERSAAASEVHADRALAALRQMADAQPDLPAPRLSVARILRSMALVQEAFGALAPLLARERPLPEALSLLDDLRADAPEDAEIALAFAAARVTTGRLEDSCLALRECHELGIEPGRLLPLADAALETQADADLWLLRAALLVDLERPDEAIRDLVRAAGGGRADEAIESTEHILASSPDHYGARRLHVDLLLRGGRAEDALRSLDAGLEANPSPPFRCELLLERSEVRRMADDESGARRDLREAEDLAEDRDTFLERVHERRTRRQLARLESASPAQKVRLLLGLGRFGVAREALRAAGLPAEENRPLRAALLLGGGAPAASLQLMRGAVPGEGMVDAAQRCDRPDLALAALDRILETRETAGLRRARGRLVRQVWRSGLDADGPSLIDQGAFVPCPLND